MAQMIIIRYSIFYTSFHNAVVVDNCFYINICVHFFFFLDLIATTHFFLHATRYCEYKYDRLRHVYSQKF